MFVDKTRLFYIMELQNISGRGAAFQLFNIIKCLFLTGGKVHDFLKIAISDINL